MSSDWTTVQRNKITWERGAKITPQKNYNFFNYIKVLENNENKKQFIKTINKLIYRNNKDFLQKLKNEYYGNDVTIYGLIVIAICKLNYNNPKFTKKIEVDLENVKFFVSGIGNYSESTIKFSEDEIKEIFTTVDPDGYTAIDHVLFKLNPIGLKNIIQYYDIDKYVNKENETIPQILEVKKKN